MRRREDKIAILFVAGAILLTLAYWLWARPHFQNWGATEAEIHAVLPGDKFIPAGSLVTTRAIDIKAPPDKIWPWLVQLGHGRGGFYSHTWLERLFATDMVNAEEIRPEWQLLKVGDFIAWRQSDFRATWTSVVLMDKPHTLVLEKGYTFHLMALDSNQTRLLVRYVWDQSLPTYYLLLEPAHFVMESGMMLGIKQRAERPLSALRPTPPANSKTEPTVEPVSGKSAPAKITGGEKAADRRQSTAGSKK